MTKKILFCATVDFHFQAFHLPYMKWFKEQGWEVHIAASGNMELPYVDQKYNISIQRSPVDTKNIKAYREVKTVIDNNKYNLIHCHTPMGGVLARVAARKARKQGTKVIYTAHGFHFCKGASLMNWLLYYPIEKILAPYTDCLITINQEDYQLATKRFKAKRIEHVHGVGINTENFKPANEKEKIHLKKSFGYHPDDFLLFYAAEFNKNKNQQLLLQSLALIKDEIPHAKLLLAGKGPLLENCQELAASLGILHMVEFLGYRNDLQKIVPMCDVAVASSLREGLPVNIMEAMACGLPVVALDNRGHRELVHNNKNGWVINSASRVEFASKIKVLAKIEDVKHKLGINGRDMILKKYSIDKVLIEKSRIYKSYTEETEGVKWAIH
ncbi:MULTISPECIES: glycosyltransferase family 4 protein [Priestia]|uniref:glycosyltransferase family 4 protein n=1 Tax=Priestia TaxID=2800373 RepID=UPI000C0822B4|nr:MULTISPECIES: glycosyltransferase family 4 protein [Priestia]MBY0061795.1 glycosyltransferase family 4 protein [Priestia aryabhattai]MDN3362342.1 glycosyltransferase family 4 protein [Priestia megaterium]